MRKELKIMQSIIKKIISKFPNVVGFALGDFEEEFGMTAKESNQYFFGWFFCNYCLYDGKSIISLIKQNFKLSKDERIFVENVENAVVGYFEFVSRSKQEIIVKDLLTKKVYSVKVIDLDYKFKKKDVIEAKLVKNFEGELFFFGGFLSKTNKRKEILENIDCYFKEIKNEL